MKIDKKTLSVGDRDLTLLHWDIAGEDEVAPIRTSYLRGSAGYFLVVDGTRGETLDVARAIQSRITSEIGPVPFLVLLNKADMQESWEIGIERVQTLESGGWTLVRTSAKTGAGVEEAFRTLAQRMLS